MRANEFTRLITNEAHPKQQLSIYNPDGKTYRGEKMPNLDDEDPVNDADRLSQQNDPGHDPHDDLNRGIDRDKLKKMVAAHLNKLPERSQEVLKMRFWDEMSLREVAQVMGITMERVRQIESKALRLIKGNYREPSNVADLRAYSDQYMEEQFCEECGGSLAEAGKASRALCKSSRSNADLGVSQLASCKSQGLRARETPKKHTIGNKHQSIKGKMVKGHKYGGPLPYNKSDN